MSTNLSLIQENFARPKIGHCYVMPLQNQERSRKRKNLSRKFQTSNKHLRYRIGNLGREIQLSKVWFHSTVGLHVKNQNSYSLFQP